MTVLQRFESYLKEVLGLVVDPREWDGTGQLPFFLRDAYTFYQIRLLNKPYLLMIARDQEEETTPAVLRKHVEKAQEKWSGDVIYAARATSSFNRKRLIAQRIAFVIPGNQMYLPPIGIDLREHFRRIRTGVQKFSPSTQTVVLYSLLNPQENENTPTRLAGRLEYTVMTLTRAFDELESAGFGEIVTRGRERFLRFHETPEELWRKAQPYLRSPVKKRAWGEPLQSSWNELAAGLSGLARYSLLAPPAQQIIAMSTEGWKIAKQRKEFVEMPGPDASPEVVEIELWTYDPQIFAQSDVVDPLSLFLSLREYEDERVEAALEEMIETELW